MKFKGFLIGFVKIVIICCSIQISFALQPAAPQPKEPKSLLEQAAKVFSKQIIEIYHDIFKPEAELKQKYYDRVKQLLETLAWEIKLPVFKALINSLEPFPLVIPDKRNKKDKFPLFILQPIGIQGMGNKSLTKWLPPPINSERLQAIKPVRTLLSELLTDDAVSEEQRNDIAGLLLKYEAWLFPGETAFTWVIDNVKDDENKKRIFEALLFFSSQNQFRVYQMETCLYLIVQATLGGHESAIETFRNLIEGQFKDQTNVERLLGYLNNLLINQFIPIVEKRGSSFVQKDIKLVDVNKIMQFKNIVEGVQKTMAQAQKPIEVQEPMEQIEEPTEQQQSKRKKHME